MLKLTEEEVETILDVLRTPTSTDTDRARAASDLRHAGSARAVPALLDALRDDAHSWVRQEAIESLGVLGHAGATPQILDRLFDLREDKYTRRAAAKTLGGFGWTPATPREKVLFVRSLSADALDWSHPLMTDAVTDEADRLLPQIAQEGEVASSGWRLAQRGDGRGITLMRAAGRAELTNAELDEISRRIFPHRVAEPEWLSPFASPARMLRHMADVAGERRIFRFVAERFRGMASGFAGDEDWRRAAAAAGRRAAGTADDAEVEGLSSEFSRRDEEAPDPNYNGLTTSDRGNTHLWGWSRLLGSLDTVLSELDELAAGEVRDHFGNPFRPVAFSPAWRTDTAVALARTMYEASEFGAMPILADALQDAGCDSAEVLDHCRGPGPHVRGCWVVDLVLGKE